jgi:hypothetical protein
LKHGIAYHGGFETNFSKLLSGATSYCTRECVTRPLPEWPASIDGVRFGYMEQPDKEFVAVRATLTDWDVVVRHAVVLVPSRHTDGKGFAPRPTTFGSESAKNLLDDLIASNPDQADQLHSILLSISPSRTGRSSES